MVVCSILEIVHIFLNAFSSAISILKLHFLTLCFSTSVVLFGLSLNYHIWHRRHRQVKCHEEQSSAQNNIWDVEGRWSLNKHGRKLPIRIFWYGFLFLWETSCPSQPTTLTSQPPPPLFFLQYYIIDLCWQMPLKNDTLLRCLIKSLASWLRSEVWPIQRGPWHCISNLLTQWAATFSDLRFPILWVWEWSDTWVFHVWLSVCTSSSLVMAPCPAASLVFGNGG